MRNTIILFSCIIHIIGCNQIPLNQTSTSAYILSINAFAHHIDSIYEKNTLINLHFGEYYNEYVNGDSIRLEEELKTELVKNYGIIKFHEEQKIEITHPPYNVLILSKLKNNTIEIGWSNGYKHFESFFIHLDKKNKNWFVKKIESGSFR